jgi:hypothetical protein
MTFSIAQPVTVQGIQFFTIEADSKEEALEKFQSGGGDFYGEQLEEYNFSGKPQIKEQK